MHVNKLVLDCSAFIEIYKTPQSNYLRQLEAAVERSTVVVPSLFMYEATNVFLKQVRLGQITSSEMFLALEHMEEAVKQVVEINDTKSLAQLAQKYTLTAYDASYLAVAKAHHAPLATLDEALKKAAIAEKIFYNPSS